MIITGASSGIGKAIAENLGGYGAKVVLAARNGEKLQAVAEKLGQQGIETLIQSTDVSKAQDCERLIQAAMDRFGKIDILVNNAGISMRALFEEVDLKVLQQLMDINFWGMVYCTKFALPYLLESQGSVVGISSIAGHRGLPGRIGYSSSKFAMQGFLESLRTENLKKGVHVLVVCPGFTRSNIRNTALSKSGDSQQESPLKESKLMSAEEVAERTAQAIKQRKRDLVLTTQGKLTVFFNKWLPAWMDKKVYDHFAREKDSPLK